MPAPTNLKPVREVTMKNKDDRDTIEALESELDFIEKGGYGRSVKSPWMPTSIFQDSPTCLNYAHLARIHPCDECLLFDFVPTSQRDKDVPCHHIPLNNAGDTIDELEWDQDQHGLEAEVKDWLRSTIGKLEQGQAKKLLSRIT